MAKRQSRRTRRHLGNAFGVLPAVFALPFLVKAGLAGGAAWYLLKKKPAPLSTSLKSPVTGVTTSVVTQADTAAAAVPNSNVRPMYVSFTPYPDVKTGQMIMSEKDQADAKAGVGRFAPGGVGNSNTGVVGPRLGLKNQLLPNTFTVLT